MVVLVALSVDTEGYKELVAMRLAAEETEDSWLQLLDDLRGRGVQTVELMVTDGNSGLLQALAETFPATPRQRCLQHKQRNVTEAVPKRERKQVAAALNGIWYQPRSGKRTHSIGCFQG